MSTVKRVYVEKKPDFAVQAKELKHEIRHYLNENLRQGGGHIGYGIRFSEWKKGYGTLMLRLALEKAKNIGITTALITCDDDNYGSAKVMENNGFVLQDKVPNVVNGKAITTRRYTKEL